MTTKEQAEAIMLNKYPTGSVAIADGGDKWECYVELLITKEWAGETRQMPVMGMPIYFIDKETGEITSKAAK